VHGAHKRAIAALLAGKISSVSRDRSVVYSQGASLPWRLLQARNKQRSIDNCKKQLIELIEITNYKTVNGGGDISKPFRPACRTAPGREAGGRMSGQESRFGFEVESARNPTWR